MEIKNMQYWKRKATLPGLNYQSENKLPSGLAKSSALQKNEEKNKPTTRIGSNKPVKKLPTTRIGSNKPVDPELIKKYNIKSKQPKPVKAKVKKPVKTKTERVVKAGKKILSNIHKAF
tara:strand:+ start:101 stop:454 length:354 start_codon:yes stop_codon:yes gene_type:complete